MPTGLHTRAKMTVSGTPGTGAITLLAAVSGFQTFANANVIDGEVVSYAIEDGANFEVGRGTYTASGTSLSRDTIFFSSNSNAAVSLTSAAIVYITALSEDFTPSFRNILLHNGGFDIWQRGAGDSASIAVAASTTAYTADRWYLTTGANEAFTVSAQAGLSNRSRLAAQIQRTASQTGTAAVTFGYPLTKDECIRLRGQQITLQFLGKAGANWSPTSGTLTYNVYFGTGTEGKRGAGFTGETNPITGTVNLTTTLSKTIKASTTLVATNVTQGEIQFTFTPAGTAGVNDWAQLDDVQCEPGASATLFEYPPFDVALEGCKRHYIKSFPYGTAPAQSGGAAGAFIWKASGSNPPMYYWRFPVSMRASPTIVTFNPAANDANWRNFTTTADTNTVSVDPTAVAKSADGVFIATSAQTVVAGDIMGIHATADASL